MEILPGPVLWSLFLLHCCIGGKKSVHYFLCIGDLLKFGGGGAGVQILPPRAGNYLLARSSTSSAASSSQPFLTASGSSVSFSLGCEYQHTAELKLCPGYPAKHQRGGPREWYF